MLDVNNLKKVYGDEVAVDGLSIQLEEGEFKTLLGPSGCGKTSTLRCIAGLEDSSGGDIYIDGDLVSSPSDGVHVPPNKRNIGMVFQSYAVWPHMTVAENVRFPLDQQEIGTEEEREKRVSDMLETVGLLEHRDNHASNLSGGQQQRVALARALITDPELLLLDEPLSNLDAKLRREMRDEIQELTEDLGITVLYVTHSQNEALFLSDKIAVMNDGSIVEEGDPISILTDPENLFTMEFMGRCNMISGHTSISENSKVIETPIGSLNINGFEDVEANTDVYMTFRPQHCNLRSTNDESEVSGNHIRLKGTIKSSGLTENMVECMVDVHGYDIEVLAQNEQLLNQTGEVEIIIEEEHVKIYPERQATAENLQLDIEATAD